jgi:hypothetical protein
VDRGSGINQLADGSQDVSDGYIVGGEPVFRAALQFSQALRQLLVASKQVS